MFLEGWFQLDSIILVLFSNLNGSLIVLTYLFLGGIQFSWAVSSQAAVDFGSSQGILQ